MRNQAAMQRNNTSPDGGLTNRLIVNQGRPAGNQFNNKGSGTIAQIGLCHVAGSA
jgi:hypothetical protein